MDRRTMSQTIQREKEDVVGIILDAPRLCMENGSRITQDSFAGNIGIRAGDLVLVKDAP